MAINLNDAYMNRIKASMIDSFTEFISIANTDREIIYYNPAAYRMMGYGPNENPDIMTTEKLHAEGFDEFAKTVIQPSVFKNGSWKGISAIRHKDGSTIPVEMTVFPLYGPEGEEYGTVAVMRDVDELTKMNERLKKSSELFQKVLDSAKIGIVLINMETNTIEMVNEYTEELMRRKKEELIGQKCYEVLCRSSLENCPHVNERDKPVLLAERYLQREDGSMLPIIKTGTWITLDDKEYLVDTFVDITIQKDLEKKLSEAKISAEAANRSKSEFLSRMSHEMRTPLNAVIGMTQISDKTDDVAKLKECIDTIKLSSNHLLSLINDILDLSKIEEGKLELSVEAFSAKTMMQKINLLIEAKAKEKGINLLMEVDEKIPPFLMGDSLRLSQVLLNFLSNAVKFTPENGEVTLTVHLQALSDSGAKLFFAVSDSGIGISDEQMSKLFNPFVQADGSITRKYGGTGLGLVISKRLVNLMGSDIDVKTTQGEGSMFSFEIELPLASEADMQEEETGTLGDVTDLFAGKKALLVDDVDVNRLIAMELLAETGMMFDEAGDGSQAVELATRERYDVILMDVQMPVMDGYEATRRIRSAEPPFSRVPIIAMSANVFKEDVERSLKEGMNAHVGKPVDADTLISSIYNLTSAADSREGMERKPAKQETTVSFREGVFAENVDKSYFNITAAMKKYGQNESVLAQLCDEFVRGDDWEKLKTAMEKREYEAILSMIDALIAKANDLAMPGLLSYASNVKETMDKKNYDYASMYLDDLGKCYAKTREVIKGLLQ